MTIERLNGGKMYLHLTVCVCLRAQQRARGREQGNVNTRRISLNTVCPSYKMAAVWLGMDSVSWCELLRV